MKSKQFTEEQIAAKARDIFDRLMDENWGKLCDLIWDGLGQEALSEAEAHVQTADLRAVEELNSDFDNEYEEHA